MIIVIVLIMILFINLIIIALIVIIIIIIFNIRILIIIYTPGVARAVLPLALSLTNWQTDPLWKNNVLLRTVRPRTLTFWANVHHLLCVTCHMSCVKCHFFLLLFLFKSCWYNFRASRWSVRYQQGWSV